MPGKADRKESVVEQRARIYGLTQKDIVALEQVARGRSNKEAAYALGIAASTYKNRLAEVFQKLGAKDRWQAAVIAAGVGLIDLHALSAELCAEAA